MRNVNKVIASLTVIALCAYPASTITIGNLFFRTVIFTLSAFNIIRLILSEEIYA